MPFPTHRPRRLRASRGIRHMVAETRLSLAELILPLFAVEGEGVVEPIASMPGVFHHSVDRLVEVAKTAYNKGIPAILLFGVPKGKDERGSGAWEESGPVPRAIRAIKAEVPELVVITDVCLCAYTSHGHCGILCGEVIENDRTLDALARMALAHARAGADLVAPSDMMDGRVGHLRETLDGEHFERTGILSYAVKYASSYYGPFRDAAGSAPAFGDRRTHQMDPANLREALREAKHDGEEGADMIMIKPALAYLDVIRAVRETVDLPVVAYNVSGEYSMVKAAAEKGWIDEKNVVLETLTGMRRAGADLIITYHALDVAAWLG